MIDHHNKEGETKIEMDFDEARLYYSHQQLQTQRRDEQRDDRIAEEETSVDLKAVRRHFREFLRK